MKLLLDTHAFLQLCRAPETVPDNARNAAENVENQVYLSIVSAWELQIKVMLGKLQLAELVCDMVQFEVGRGAITILPIELPHVGELSHLPPIHRDPFDRMIIAQARSENMTLLSGDGPVHLYPVDWLWG